MATTTKKGLMSATDKKYNIQFVNFGVKRARKILQMDDAYKQFVTVGFLLSGGFPLNFILSGRTEAETTRLSINYKIINRANDMLKIYKKENCFYLENASTKDSCTGFLISTQTIGTDDVTIDDSFTLIE